MPVSKSSAKIFSVILLTPCREGPPGLQYRQVHEIIFIGGSTASTRISRVVNTLLRLLQRQESNRSINPEEAVAYGAAVQPPSSMTTAPRRLRISSWRCPFFLWYRDCWRCHDRSIKCNTTVPTKNPKICPLTLTTNPVCLYLSFLSFFLQLVVYLKSKLPLILMLTVFYKCLCLGADETAGESNRITVMPSVKVQVLRLRESFDFINNIASVFYLFNSQQHSVPIISLSATEL